MIFDTLKRRMVVRRRKNFAKGAMMGVALGSAAGILFAPKSGKETRESMKNVYNDAREEIMDKVSKVSNLTEQKYNELVRLVLRGYIKASKMSAREASRMERVFEQNYKDVENELKKRKR